MEDDEVDEKRKRKSTDGPGLGSNRDARLRLVKGCAGRHCARRFARAVERGRLGMGACQPQVDWQ